VSRPDYPPSPAQPVANVIGGVGYDDPFQWLEADSDAVRAWQDAQNALTTRSLAGYPQTARLRQLLDDRFVDMFAFHAPRQAGGRWWRQYRPAEARFHVLEAAPTRDAQGRVVLDLNRIEGASQPLLGPWEPSPDGRLLLYALSDGGAPMTHRVVEIDTGRPVMEGLDRPGAMFVVWDADGTALYFTAMALEPGPDGNPYPVARLYRQAVGSGTTSQAEPIELPHPAAWPVLSADHRHLLVMMDQTAARPAYVRRLPDGEWRPFLLDFPASCKGHLIGDEYVAVTTLDAPRGRLVAVPLASPMDPSSWRELLPESDAKLASVTPMGNQLLLADFVDGQARLRVLDPDGRVRTEVPLPENGGAGKFALGYILSIIDDVVAPGPDGVTFVHSSITRGPVSYHCSSDGGLTALSTPKAVLDDVAVELRYARSADGTRVPYRVYRPRQATGAGPTVLTGYGGFNVPWLPAYDPMAAAWLAAGGTWVFAHLRGGGEFGTDWWQAGRMRRKQNTFDDFFAVAEALIADGVTTADQLGVWGSSNGGLLVGAAVVQRPELFAASVPQVPILDLLRFKNDPMSFAIAVADYGNPDVPEDARALYACSPYHGVKAGLAYPAVLLDAGATDTSCPPWHARKMAARLQQGTSGTRPILLRVRGESGHNTMSEEQVRERLLEELVFLAHHTGLPA